MKNLKENRNTFPNWMYCKKTEIDLSKSGTGLFPGAFYMNRHVKRVILPDYADTVPANMFKGCFLNVFRMLRNLERISSSLMQP